MLDRRTFNASAAALAASSFVPAFAAESKLEVNDDGLHVQPWFLQSFLDLREDHAELAGQGKHFAVLFEQRGCPYCRELHRVNLQKQKIVDYLKAKYGILQLNMWGSRMVTDFDGKEMEEKELARRWAVNFTPTTVLFGKQAPEGKSGKDIEVARMPGYFKPFHFVSMFEYVEGGAYEKQGFQRFLQDKFKEMEARGEKPEVW